MNAFIKEIKQQASALRETLEYYLNDDQGKDLLLSVRKIFDEKLINHVIFTGMGSSYFNSIISEYFLSSKGISSEVKDTGELLDYCAPPDEKKTDDDLAYFRVSIGGIGRDRGIT